MLFVLSLCALSALALDFAFSLSSKADKACSSVTSTLVLELMTLPTLAPYIAVSLSSKADKACSSFMSTLVNELRAKRLVGEFNCLIGEFNCLVGEFVTSFPKWRVACIVMFLEFGSSKL